MTPALPMIGSGRQAPQKVGVSPCLSGSVIGHGQSFADPEQVSVTARICHFQSAGLRHILPCITTLKRGSIKCAKRTSFLLSPFFRWLAASSQTRPRPVRAWVPLRARPLARSRKTILQNPLLSVAPSACWQATQASAADLATVSDTSHSASRGYPSAGRMHFRARAFGPARVSEGREPCSRKS